MSRRMIELRCPKCPATKLVRRQRGQDPRGAEVMEIICPACDNGDRHSPRYFTADGAELLFGRDFGWPK